MKRVINFKTLFGVFAVTAFVGSQLVAVAGAAIWALIGYFGFGETAAVVFAGCSSIPILIALWKVARLAYETETDPANN
ncbi:hypothetical protein E2A64_11975 [Pseudohoeflea suaedae]|uniref:Uncharacterized protein n=1 Tax=Pseudohoeflea suaedae TaxID=877384 RepID=A0A4V3A744_9HYPH|nr:hypothetical protein [Pseudohoeflea suaedae]TDH36012.1 hypothetical protein E2A64_11975 [Pseudohoeflea suaedae]